jgi:hypothetical protein
MKAKTSQRTAKALKPLSAKKPPEATDGHLALRSGSSSRRTKNWLRQRICTGGSRDGSYVACTIRHARPEPQVIVDPDGNTILVWSLQ